MTLTVVEAVTGSLGPSIFCASVSATVQEKLVSAIVSGDRVRVEVMMGDGVVEDWGVEGKMVVRPPDTTGLPSLSRQVKVKTMVPLSTAWLTMAEHSKVVSSIPPATRAGSGSVTLGAETRHVEGQYWGDKHWIYTVTHSEPGCPLSC